MNLDPDIVAIIEKIGGPIHKAAPKPEPRPKYSNVQLSRLAMQLLARNEAAQKQVMVTNSWKPHAFPPREVNAFWVTDRCPDFEAHERSYHGVLPKQEAGNLTHDLTTLLKRRK
jgi:hypothetical protein